MMRSQRAPCGAKERRCNGLLLDDRAVQHPDLSPAAVGDTRIVRDQEQGRAVLGLVFEQEAVLGMLLLDRIAAGRAARS